MNNLLFTALIIALLYYFFYYLPHEKKKEEFTPSPKFNPNPFTPSESDKQDNEIKFPSADEIYGPEANPDPHEKLKNQVSALEKDIQQKDKEITSLKRLETTKTREAQKITQDLNNLKKQLDKKNLEIKELSEAENQIDLMIKNIQNLAKDLDYA